MKSIHAVFCFFSTSHCLRCVRLFTMMVAGCCVAGYRPTSCLAQAAYSATQQGPVMPSASVPMVGSPSAVCPKCGRIHGSSTIQAVSAVGSRYSTVPTSQSSPPQNPANRLRSTGGTSNVLAALNQQRARQGLGSLQYDPALQAVATRRAQLMASTGNKSHPPGSFSPGRYEGVGWSSSYSPAGVSACFTSDPNMRVAGAAMATGSDGVYFCVVYR